MQFQPGATEPATLPYSAVAFRRYLTDYGLKPLDVAAKTGVRYMTVWRIWEGHPINSQHELLVRQGLLRLTGIPYTAPILVSDEMECETKPLRDSKGPF